MKRVCGFVERRKELKKIIEEAEEAVISGRLLCKFKFKCLL
jgi:hypothetical protein